MARSSDSVLIGKGPDFALRSGHEELNHNLSYVVFLKIEDKWRPGPTDSYSDRSLKQACDTIKQKVSPYGWIGMIESEWTAVDDLCGRFSNGSMQIIIKYKYPHRLRQDQKNQLTGEIKSNFKQNSGTTNS
jgi:hypothetical protein